MKEEVLYVKLPENAKYRRVEITEDGMIGIVYSKECICEVKIPKPKSLIGGSEVYQKDDDVPYWYCKIKDGRDEFMHLYMEDLTEEDLLYDPKTGRKRKFYTEKQKAFKEEVLKALANKPKEVYRWLPVFEPSYDEYWGLQFVTDEKPYVRQLDCFQWEEILRKYSPENGSGMSSKTTYFLLLLRWLKDGIATLEQLADNSEKIGHYWESKNVKRNHDQLEITGKRKFGGLYGFVGNTCKIVKDSESEQKFSKLGGDCFDFHKKYPLSHVFHIYFVNMKDSCVGLLELTK